MQKSFRKGTTFAIYQITGMKKPRSYVSYAVENYSGLISWRTAEHDVHL